MVSRYTSIPTTFRFTLNSTVDDATSAVDRFATCLTDVEAWLRAIRFRLNPTKTQVMWLGSRHATARQAWYHPCARSLVVTKSPGCSPWPPRCYRQLVITLGSRRYAVCRSGYYQLRQLRQAVRSWSEDASKTLVHAFVSCRLDYCNALFFDISERLMNRLQSAQNAAAHLVTGTRRSDHITPVLRYNCYRDARASTSRLRRSFIGRCLALADDRRLVADTRERRLRSTPSRTCVVTRTYSISTIDHLQLLDSDYRTVFHRTWKRRTNRKTDSVGRKCVWLGV